MKVDFFCTCFVLCLTMRETSVSVSHFLSEFEEVSKKIQTQIQCNMARKAKHPLSLVASRNLNEIGSKNAFSLSRERSYSETTLVLFPLRGAGTSYSDTSDENVQEASETTVADTTVLGNLPLQSMPSYTRTLLT